MFKVEKIPPFTKDSLITSFLTLLSTVKLYSIDDCSYISGFTSSIVKLLIFGEFIKF